MPPHARSERSPRTSLAAAALPLLAALAVLAALAPSAAFGAGPRLAPAAIGLPLRVTLELYDPCFSLTDATGTEPVVVIHRRKGALIGTVSVPVSDRMRPCTGTLRPNDTIELRRSGQQLRLLSVPALKLRVDLDEHQVVGWVPVGMGSGTVGATHQIAGLEVYRESGPILAAPDGWFHWEPSSPANLWRGDIVRLSWTSSEFDAFTLLASTPSVTVSTWTPRLTATATRAGRVDVVVSRGSVVRATYRRKLPPYEVLTYGQLRKNGAPARPVTGDVVTHSGIKGVALTLLSNAISVDPKNNGSLSTTCFPGGQGVVDTNDRHRGAFRVPASGIVNLSSLNGGDGDLQPGDVILVGCQNRKGGAQLKRYVVP